MYGKMDGTIKCSLLESLSCPTTASLSSDRRAVLIQQWILIKFVDGSSIEVMD
jgi:hypothetical protein